MAELHVQRKKNHAIWIWLFLVLLILAAGAYYYIHYYQQNNTLGNGRPRAAVRERNFSPMDKHADRLV